MIMACSLLSSIPAPEKRMVASSTKPFLVFSPLSLLLLPLFMVASSGHWYGSSTTYIHIRNGFLGTKLKVFREPSDSKYYDVAFPLELKPKNSTRDLLKDEYPRGLKVSKKGEVMKTIRVEREDTGQTFVIGDDQMKPKYEEKTVEWSLSEDMITPTTYEWEEEEEELICEGTETGMPIKWGGTKAHMPMKIETEEPTGLPFEGDRPNPMEWEWGRSTGTRKRIHDNNIIGGGRQTWKLIKIGD